MAGTLERWHYLLLAAPGDFRAVGTWSSVLGDLGKLERA